MKVNRGMEKQVQTSFSMHGNEHEVPPRVPSVYCFSLVAALVVLD